ncbi:MAG: carboxypeptidase regulatory-like domain-containing protein, partial [Saprospiraceae bacterium]|nr:carboxypeptidase regulatory-like domain-containing protein [Saprospiraceae bacterium]
DLTLDAGFFVKAKVGDFVWEDTNGNGIQDGGEPGIENVQVSLVGMNNQGIPVSLSTSTDNTGMYMFGNLVPGIYKITFAKPAGYKSSPADATNNDAIDSDADPLGATPVFMVFSGDTIPTFDAGFYKAAEIGNYVWEDLNADGIQNDGPTGIPGVEVILSGTDGAGNPVNKSTTTDASGYYLFPNLAPGSYKLSFVTPAGGYVSTTANDPDANPNDEDDSDADPAMGGMTVFEVLESGESNLTYDAGYYIPASIGNFVWNDLNSNGIQESGETGIPNVTVTLTGTDGQGNPVSQTTTTDGQGNYEFTNLVPGTYKLTFTMPAGYQPSPVDATVDNLDSDADPNMGGMTVNEVLVSGENNMDYDAGYYGCPEITISDLPVDLPICPLAEVGAIQIITVPGATTISWTGGAAIGLADGFAPGPIVDIPAFIATAEGTVTVTVTAYLGGCEITKTFELEVNDDEAPIFANCPPNITVTNYPDQCGASPTWDEPVVIDDCATPSNTLVLTQTDGQPSGTFLAASNTPYYIKYVANDGNGNTSECDFTIVVEDNENPTITCPADVTVTTSSNGTGDCSFDMPDFIPDAIPADNCGGQLNIVQIPAAGTGTSGAHGAQFDVTLVVTDTWGNTSSCVLEITLHDDEKPEFVSTPTSPIDLECGENLPPVPTITATDNCSTPDVQMDYTEITDPGPCLNAYTITRIWTASDIAGNSTSVTQVLNISDTEAPVLVGLPADITVNVECAEEVPEVPEVTATDNCAAPVDVDFTEVEVPGTCPNKYQIVRTWTAVDACGNSTVFVQTITINDTENPELLISTTVNTPVTATWDFDNSNLSGVSSNTNFITASNASLGSSVDPDGYPSGCGSSHMLAVDDWHFNPTSSEYVDFKVTTKPGTMFHLSNVAFDHTRSSNGPTGYRVMVNGAEVGSGSVTNSCGNASINLNLNYGGSTMITVRIIGTGATDNHGDLRIDNVVFSGEAVETVTIPSVVNVECSEDLPEVPEVSATDNCNKPLFIDFSEVTEPGGCLNHYSIIRTWTAQDDCGNSTQFVQTIHVSDTEAPVLVGLPTEATVTGDCTDDLPAIPVVTATDNCTSPVDVEFSETIEPGDCANSYTVTRTWTAEDACGNATAFTQTIEINDTEAPVLVGLPVDEIVNIVCADDMPVKPVVSATDNCTAPIDVEYSEMTIPGSCPNQYTLMRIWTAEDACGNATSFVQTINVSDTEAPELLVTPFNLQLDCIDDVPAAPYQTATDNCGEAFVDFSESSEPGNCPNSVVITRRWVAYDLCGNSTEWEQTITVLDEEAPHLIVTPLDLTLSCSENIPTAPTQVATDNCGVVLVDFSETTEPGGCQNSYTVVRGWVVSDLCGNTAEWWQHITVIDTEAPVLLVTPLDLQVDCSEDIPAAPLQTATDNCGIAYVDFAETVEPGGCENSFTLVRRWIATDLCGNSSEHWQHITVNDTEAPQWTSALPQDITVQCGEDVQAATLTASDNCLAPVDIDFSETLLPGSGPNDGAKLTRTWTATDVCGNAIQHTQVVTILDTEAPQLQGTPAATVDVVCAEDVPAVANVTVTDNCLGTVDLDFNETVLPGDCAHNFTLTRTWTAVDFAGNSTEFVQTIMVNDNVAPTWTSALPQDANVQCGEAVQPASLTASDNCSGDVQIDFSETLLPGSGPNDGAKLTRTWTAT